MTGSKYGHYGVFSPELEQYLAEAAASKGGLMRPDMALSELRAALKNAEQATWLPYLDQIDAEDHQVPTVEGHQVPIRIWRPKTDTSSVGPHDIALAVHGGGWTVGSEYADSFLTRTLVSKFNMVVVTCDYRLSPEHPYPSALEDVKAVFEWMTSRSGVDKILSSKPLEAHSDGIYLCGFSAGANLAASLALWIRDLSQVQKIKAQILISPATCHYRAQAEAVRRYGCELDSLHSAGTAILGAEQLTSFWDNYYPQGSDDPGRMLISPLLAQDCSGLPPTYIQVSGADPLRDEGIAYAQRLKDAGVPTDMQVYSGMPHAYQSDLLKIPSREKALEHMAQWIQSRIIANEL
ncbi:hypothetical protein KCU85_g9355, partial [Aureobasidium melanogenum]